MTAESAVSNERWSRAIIGLPADFLRLSTTHQTQETIDRETAIALQHQMHGMNPTMAANTIGRLSVTVAQAKLVKNYGITRMDPYVRVRVGHYIYETQTDPNGGKTPRWNRVFHAQLPAGVSKIFVEIYDECNFTMDELIAWAEVRIPDVVVERGETHEDWYPLSGKTGDFKEGMIDLVFTFTPAAAIRQQPIQNLAFLPSVGGRPGSGLPVFVHHQVPLSIQQQQQAQQAQQPPPVQPLTDDDIVNLMEMFPSIDKEVIKSIGEANRGNKEATINSLLQLTN